jgi:hypothetical protein
MKLTRCLLAMFALALLAAPVVAAAQPPEKVPRIGFWTLASSGAGLPSGRPSVRRCASAGTSSRLGYAHWPGSHSGRLSPTADGRGWPIDRRYAR